MNTKIDGLEFEISSNVSTANSELDKLISKLKQVQTALGKDSAAVKEVSASAKTAVSSGTSGFAALTTSVAKLGIVVRTLKRSFDLLGAAIKNSMDYSETVNLFQTAMRTLGKKAGSEFEYSFLDKAEEFQDMLTNSLTIDPDTTMNYQAQFANMASSMGVASSTAYDLSESFTMLGADIASLFNMSLSDSMTKLQSALAGQSRAIRSLGVDITQTTMQEKAFELGITKSVTAMTQAEKTQLRYIMIMEGLAVAQGDMARTIDSPANQLRVLSEQFNLLTRAIGNVFMPVVQAVLPYINALVIGLKKLFTALASLVGYELPDYKETPIAIVDTDEADKVDDVAQSVKKLKSYTAGFDELNIFSKDSASDASGAAGGSFDLSDKISEMNAAYKEMVEQISQEIGNQANNILSTWEAAFAAMGTALESWAAKFNPAVSAIKSAVETAIPSITQSFASIGSSLQLLWSDTLAPMLNYFLNDWLPGIVNPIVETFAPIFSEVAASAFRAFADAFGWAAKFINTLWTTTLQPVFELIKTIVSDVMQSISKAWDTYGTPILTKAEKLIDGLCDTFQLLWDNILYPIVKPFLEALEAAWSNAIKPIVDQVAMLVAKLVDAALDIWNQFISPVVNYLVTVLQPVASAVGAAISLIVTNVSTVIHNIISGILTVLSGLIDFITGVFTGDWGRAWEGIKTVFSGIWETITSVLTGALALIQTAFQVFADIVKGIWDSIWTAVKDTFNTVVDALKTALNGFISSFKEAWCSFWTGTANFFIRIWNKIIGGFETAVNWVISGLNKLIEAVNSVSSLLGMTFSTISPISVSRVEEIQVQGYANGGLPDYGELFLARENGIPEMVGSFGQSSGVANNEQIVDGIAQGVATANDGIISVLYDLIQEVRQKDMSVQIGDETIGRSYDRYTSNRGVRVNDGAFANAY